MSSMVQTPAATFVDRRNYESPGARPELERRQFTNSHEGLSPDARELASAIDHYKLVHRRRFITYEEMLGVIQSLGYEKRAVECHLVPHDEGAILVAD